MDENKDLLILTSRNCFTTQVLVNPLKMKSLSTYAGYDEVGNAYGNVLLIDNNTTYTCIEFFDNRPSEDVKETVSEIFELLEQMGYKTSGKIK